MGAVYADITLKNSGDLTRLQDGSITENNVRTVTLRALVDTGATSLIINEDICNQLGLTIEKTRTASLADGTKVNCKITEPVRIYWKDRDVAVQAVVLPESEPLIGVIPLEFMDLIIDPLAEELVGAHGDRMICRVY